MERNVPQTSTTLKALLKADFTTQWRNRRAVILTLVVPLIILISWKGLVKILGGPFVLSNSITIGLVATGLMGYSNAVARDRDKGIFQRLRVAPIPAWCIMGSRLMVQLAMILIITVAVFILGYQQDHILLSSEGYVLTFFAAIISGMLYLSLGQVIVGRIQNPETVNTTSRLIYFVFIMVGMLGEIYLSKMGNDSTGRLMRNVVIWSPYGTVKTILAASMEPAKWNMDATRALLATIAYTLVCCVLGIRWFKWSNK